MPINTALQKEPCPVAMPPAKINTRGKAAYFTVKEQIKKHGALVFGSVKQT